MYGAKAKASLSSHSKCKIYLSMVICNTEGELNPLNKIKDNDQLVKLYYLIISNSSSNGVSRSLSGWSKIQLEAARADLLPVQYKAFTAPFLNKIYKIIIDSEGQQNIQLKDSSLSAFLWSFNQLIYR